VATNVYLMLYPKPALTRALRSHPHLVEDIWRALNELPASALAGEGRLYGGGMAKIEPRELGRVPADRLAALLHDDVPVTVPAKQLLLLVG
jgi:adenine-specific DNA-methyltransferase